MASRTTKDKILTKTNYKVIVKIDRIGEALTKDEVNLFQDLLKKIESHDKERG